MSGLSRLSNPESSLSLAFQRKTQSNSISSSCKTLPLFAFASNSGQGKNPQVSVCTNKSCRKSGSLDVVEYFRNLAPPHVEVVTTGCLGKCGDGPNISISPGDVHVSRCCSALHVARLLERQCGAHDSDTNLKSFELFTGGCEAFSKGYAAEAERLFSQAIDLNPSGGLHNIYCSRSETRAAQGNIEGALDDAREALHLKPQWSKALIREAQAHEAAGDILKALEVYAQASNVDAEFRRSKLYQRKRKLLGSHLAPAFA